jgi:hypothetical protein
MKNFSYNFYNKIIIGILLFSSIGFCQIPNAGFENWTNGNPDNWSTTNNSQFTNIIQSKNAHSGSYSVEGIVTSFSGFSISPLISTTFLYTGRPSGLSGYYKLSSVNSDTLVIAIALYKNDNAIGGGIFSTSTNANSFTQFNLPITYISSATPDSAGIVIYIGPTVGAHSGSTFYIDDLALGSATAVDENSTNVPDQFELKQNYPNPFNPTTTIEYQIPNQSHVVLKVYDVLGNQVAVLVNKDEPAGKYNINFNASKLSSGVYFYRINTGNFIQTKKFMVLK